IDPPSVVRRKDRKLRYSVSSWFAGVRGLINVIAVPRVWLATRDPRTMNRKARKHEGFLDLQDLRGASGLRGSASCDADRSIPVGCSSERSKASLLRVFVVYRNSRIDRRDRSSSGLARDERPETMARKARKHEGFLDLQDLSRRFGSSWFGVVRRGSIPRRCSSERSKASLLRVFVVYRSSWTDQCDRSSSGLARDERPEDNESEGAKTREVFEDRT